MFFFEYDGVHELHFTNDGTVIGDPNGIDFRDVPPENLHTSADYRPPTRYVDINDIVDGLDLNNQIRIGGVSYWEIEPDEEDGLFDASNDEDDEIVDDLENFDDHGDVEFAEDDIDTDEAQPPSVVPIRPRIKIPLSLSRRLIRCAPKGR